MYDAAAVWLTTWKKSRLNWKLKVSNTAHNAGITQSQARDTKCRRMQELNSLCVSKKVNNKQLCHLSSTPVGNALCEAILQCVSNQSINQSINQSKRIYIAPYVAGESEARVGLG